MAESNKKPNSFTKGMQSDIDPNLLPSESYKTAINARLMTKQDNLFVLNSAEGNALARNLSDAQKTFSSLTFGTLSTDTRTIGSTNYTVSRYIDNIIASITFGGATHTTTYYHVDGESTDEEVLIINAFNQLIYPEVETTGSAAIKAAFDVNISIADKTLQLIPYYSSSIGDYSIAATAQEKSATFQSYVGYTLAERGSLVDTSLDFTTTFGIETRSDTVASISDNWSGTDSDITILGYASALLSTYIALPYSNATKNNLLTVATNSGENAIYFISKTDQTVSFVPSMTRTSTTDVITSAAFGSVTAATNNGNGYTTANKTMTFATNSSSTSYQIVGLETFSDYMIALCHNAATGKDNIIKLSVADNGTITTAETIFGELDLGFTAKTLVRTEKSEENEKFHRLYWTDGTNPLRTINLKESVSYYQNLTSANELNVFNSKYQKAPDITSILTGGSVSCGSHSYCYRLKSEDGKLSKISNISEPIHVSKTSRIADYHEIKGGPPEGANNVSNSSVKIEVDGISSAFSQVEIIDILYIDEIGSIQPRIIGSGLVEDGKFTYVHNGNETTTEISIAEIFKTETVWSTCKDLAIKDNRLFAVNLSSDLSDITESFRVKSYRRNRNTNAWEKQDGLINTDLGEDVIYDDGISSFENIGYYGYLKGSDYSNAFIPGAESDGFATGTGVRVTFNTKKFPLSDCTYFQRENSGIFDSGDQQKKNFTSFNKAPLFSQNLRREGADGFYDNYKNPLFVKDFKGYQRGEVYRFGILFYDRNLNPGFVNPIGDIRMPDNSTNFSTLNAAGSAISIGADGQTTFKYCGTTSFTDSTTDTSDGAATVAHVANTAIVVGLHVYGDGIPEGTRITTINSTTQFTMSNNATASQTNVTLNFVNPTEKNIDGYVLFPQFDVKLSADILAKIGGYSIVRVDRTDSDKRIIQNGVITPVINMQDNDSSKRLRNKLGLYATPYGSPDFQHEGLKIGQTTFTFDSPESNLANKPYIHKVGDKIGVSARLDSVQNTFTEDNVPSDTTLDSELNSWTGVRAKESGNLAAGRFFLGGESATNNSAGNSIYTVFTLNDDSFFYYNLGNVGPKGRHVGDDIYKPIKHAQAVEPGGTVSSAKNGYDIAFTGAKNKDFHNYSLSQARQDSGGTGSGIYVVSSPISFTADFYDASSSGWGDSKFDGRAVLEGCATTFISLDDDKLIESHQFGCGDSSKNILQRINYNANQDNEDGARIYSSKMYCTVTRDVSTSAYGGNELSNFLNNRYMLTGHENFSPTSSDRVDVFGGDTYINMYSLRKLVYISDRTDGHAPNVGFVFPVESTVNLDMRDGNFFGVTDTLAHNVQDDLSYNSTYSSRNTSKTFLQKPEDFDQINTMSNMIAASSLKISGDTLDAYTDFPAAEVHELNTKFGPIYNIFNLRGDLFTLQSGAVAKLSVNPRVVVDNADAAAVTIATGTGRVIERSDYVDTQYGSQHYNNVITTGVSAYWFDSYQSAFCKLVYGQGIVVQDLGVVTQNANLFDALKDLQIKDEPLDLSKGGVALAHDYRHSEVTLSVTHPTFANNLSITYSELSDVMVSKKYQSVAKSINHKGELYTVGYTKLAGSDDISSGSLWLENSLNNANSYYNVTLPKCLDVTFVCNESVYSTKKFDKLVMYCSGNINTKKFTTFTFTDSMSGSSITNNEFSDRMANGKHIIPITDGTNKAQGQYLIINATAPIASYPVELFGALVHNRIVK